MSIGHLRYEKKDVCELYDLLGQGDTPKLYARKPIIDTCYDWPYAGGNSIDGRTVYIDRVFYREIMDGKIYVRGMTPRQIVQAIIEHEHTEFSVDAGDNPVDNYPAAHGFAIAKEHRFVSQLPINPERYEECIKPGLKRCLKRFIALNSKANPPRDAWCGPVLDDPDDNDREILRILRAKGVEDAFKVAKPEVRYGIGPDKCVDCSMFGDQPPNTGNLRTCELVSGLVRDTRYCIKWQAKRSK